MLEGLRYVSIPRSNSNQFLMSAFFLSRLSYGVSTRLPRIAPDQALQYKQWSIPVGVSLRPHFTSSTTINVSLDPRRHDQRVNAPQRNQLPRFLQLYPRAVDGSRSP